MRASRRALLMAACLPAASPLRGAGTPSTPSQDRRTAVAGGPPVAAMRDKEAVVPGRVLAFPRDHGAHPASRIEWWYATGWLARGSAGLLGFQLTFFRSRTGFDGGDRAGRFVPRQLLFGHAAVTVLQPGGHRHAQRIARWSGDPAAAAAHAATDDTRVRLGPWRLDRIEAPGGSRYRARLAAPQSGFTLELRLDATQPLLLQGEAGYSRKGAPPHASHYYTQPQLDAQGTVTIDGREAVVRGRGWLDHEWSDTLMPPEAVGWDWMGVNLDDGGALTAFQLRGADGRPTWAGGSHRPSGGAVQDFAADEVRFTALQVWTSPATSAVYPVRWQVDTPAGRFVLRALLAEQELDSRASTGAVYWEGLSELLDRSGQRIGLGYLEMTGRNAALRLP